MPPHGASVSLICDSDEPSEVAGHFQGLSWSRFPQILSPHPYFFTMIRPLNWIEHGMHHWAIATPPSLLEMIGRARNFREEAKQ